MCRTETQTICLSILSIKTYCFQVPGRAQILLWSQKRKEVSMEKVYIISRYRAKEERQQKFNVAVAQYFARQAVFDGKLPIVPHIYFTQFLDDSDADERGRGLDLGMHAIRHCDEFLIVVIDGILSEGMKAEIAEVSRLKIPGRIITLTRKEFVEMVKNSR